ncbi:MAG: hypothetical protein IJ217_02905 [Clostridia bacterium]|nr:hypothetical protein [Clostridia bacterium]
MKHIYIILSQSGTGVSKFLKFFSHKEYNHSSLALDKSLDEFYSFGRKKVNNFLNGGFVIEKKDKGVFEKWPNTPCLVIEKEVTDEQYERIETIIRKGFIENRENYKYDFFAVPFVNTNWNIQRADKYFCSSFVASILNSVDIQTIKAPNHMEPIDFLQLENSKIIYEGILQEYNL